MNRHEFESHAIPALDGLYAYALRLAGNPEDAADLVQDTYVKALRHVGTFREIDAVRPMLFKILYRCFVDAWRRKKRGPPLAVISASGEIEGASPIAATCTRLETTWLKTEALSEDVGAALGDLDGELRETLWLREIEDFSYAEIAKIMAIPTGTVRSRLSRARAQLAASLQEYANQRGYIHPRAGKERS